MTNKPKKSTYNTQLLISSFIVLIAVSIILGLLLSKNQSYSPLPSLNGLIIEILVLVLCGGFVAYANYMRSDNTKPGKRTTRSLDIGSGSVLAGFLIAYLVRMIIII